MKLQASAEDRGHRLDVFLTSRLDRVTRSHVQALNKSGAIRIDGLQEKDGYKIRGSETIEIDLRPAEPISMEAVSMSLKIHYEDEDEPIAYA